MILTITYGAVVLMLSLGYIFSKSEREMYSDESFIEVKQKNEE